MKYKCVGKLVLQTRSGKALVNEYQVYAKLAGGMLKSLETRKRKPGAKRAQNTTHTFAYSRDFACFPLPAW